MALSDKLEMYQLFDEEVCKQVSDVHLEEISRDCCEMWRRLPSHLGLKKTLKDDINRKTADEREKRHDFLTEWKQRKGSDATYKALINALLKIDCVSDAEYVCKLLANAKDAHSGAKAHSSSGAGDSHVASLPKLKDEMKMDLEYILQKSLNQITDKYAAYVDTLRRAVIAKGVTTEDLRSYLLAKPASRTNLELTLLADKKEELKQCQSVTDIFNFLMTDYASFLNFDIFQSILEYYGIVDQDEKNLQYAKHLNDYLQRHNVSEFIKVNPHLETQKDIKEVNLKLDVKTICRLSKIMKIKIVLAEILDIIPSALHIVDIQDGCIIVTLRIPRCLADVLFTSETVFTTEQKEALGNASIVWIKCNGNTFYFKKSMESYFTSYDPGEAFSLNVDRYVNLMEKLIGEAEFLQDNPPKFIPEEDRVIKHLLEALGPHTKENGGVLSVDHVTFVANRGNLIVEYSPEGATGTVSFIGSHLDVVPANPETWERNPFKMIREGDKLYGRGTTDCLGHVALLTDLFIQLAEKKPKLKFSVIAVFIAAEESMAIPGVGVDKLMEVGKLDRLKNGPVYWVDSADSHPCIATASGAMWTLRVEGRLFHSGLPHKAINSLELAMEAVNYIQTKFYQDFPPHPSEEHYKFATPSNMKPTQICCSEGAINQIPAWTEVQGDVRVMPFYSIQDCMARIESYVKELNDDVTKLPTRGPCSKYAISIPEGEFVGKIDIKFAGEPFKGIAVNLDSDSFKHLHASTMEVLGESKPYSVTGCLPLVGDLQEAGYDVQICGYGHSSVYHGDNEYCSISAMEKGFKIICGLLTRYNQ